MCTKNVEKVLDFNHEIKQLYEISLEDDLRYIKSDLGINATGFIYVIGKYDDGDGIKEFEELLEVDILAPFEKIDSESNFEIKIDEYDYHVLHGDLLLEINLRIIGLLDENKKIMNNKLGEIIVEDDSIKNENMEAIEEKIDEFLYKHDEDNLTANKLTSIINKVIKESREEENLIINHEECIEEKEIINSNGKNESEDNILDVEVASVLEEIPQVVESIYRDELMDHILGFEEEPREFLENVGEETLSDVLYDHILGVRGVTSVVDENEALMINECDCVNSCDITKDTIEEEIILKEFNPMFEPSFDRFVFYSNASKEYDLQHEKCQNNREALIHEDSIFNLPLYKEEELLVMPLFEKGMFMRKEWNELMNDDMYDVDDFMNDLDDLEEEIDEYPEITNIDNLIDIEAKIEECESNENNIDKQKDMIDFNDICLEQALFEDILDDTNNLKISVRYYVVKDGDSYFTLASKYGIDERIIAKHNRYKVLERGCVIEIPIS